MKLIFCRNDFKYEIEGVMKLFIPATLFESEFTDNVPQLNGDYALIDVDKKADEILLNVTAVYNNKHEECHEIFPASSDNDTCELALSRMLFRCMEKLTGKTSEWGIITGIRPVKRVNSLLMQGKSKDEIHSIMKERYLCSDKKFELAWHTAVNQKMALETNSPKAFGLYVSIPFCPTRCSYCSFVSQSIEGCMKLIPQYVDKLCEEIRYTGQITAKLGLYPDTVYFGGGTPTTLTASQLDILMKTIAKSFDLSKVREYTVEAGRPDTITLDKLETLKANGCTRVSINPQTLSDSVLENIGRKHTVQQFYDSFDMAEKLHFDSINTDIIAGLPSDTAESFRHTIDKLIKMKPENITVHTLSIKRAARLNHTDNEQVLENPAGDMVAYASEQLLKSGYKPYYLYRQKNMLENQENTGWCTSGHESLYNIYIMEEVQTIIAVGAAGSTKLVDMKNHRLERVFNYKFPLEYIKHFDIMLEKKKEIEDFYAVEE